jgi:hypothetical protein
MLESVKIEAPILVVAALVIAPTIAFAQPTNAKPRAGAAAVQSTNIPIRVFFDGARAADPTDLLAEAKTALKSKGLDVPESCSCFMRVQIGGSDAGCIVILQEQSTTKYYQVEFNPKGEVRKAFAAQARVHGDSYSLPSHQTVPKGAVPVRP